MHALFVCDDPECACRMTFNPGDIIRRGPIFVRDEQGNAVVNKVFVTGVFPSPDKLTKQQQARRTP